MRAGMAIPAPARPSPGEDRARQVRTLFSEIAPRYDLLNHLLSLNVDRRWRRGAVDRLGWETAPRGRFLDACAGTFDLGLELARRPGFQGLVVASDFAFPMLRHGVDKLRGEALRPVCADSLRLPFPDGSFQGAMVAFGVRNLADRLQGLQELARILEAGRKLVVLDFSEPGGSVLRPLYLFYFRKVLPTLGRLVSGHPWAYAYLPASVQEFPPPAGLAREMENAGFREVHWELLTGGIAALHVAVR